MPGLYAAGDNIRGIMLSGAIGVQYIESVLSALTSAGIFSGNGDGSIAADSALTRAQVAELLLRVRRYCR